jgi:hypothetical protein
MDAIGPNVDSFRRQIALLPGVVLVEPTSVEAGSAVLGGLDTGSLGPQILALVFSIMVR